MFSVAAASRIHRFSYLQCILTGSGPFSVLSSHMEGWDTPLDVPRGQARGKCRAM